MQRLFSFTTARYRYRYWLSPRPMTDTSSQTVLLPAPLLKTAAYGAARTFSSEPEDNGVSKSSVVPPANCNTADHDRETGKTQLITEVSGTCGSYSVDRKDSGGTTAGRCAMPISRNADWCHWPASLCGVYLKACSSTRSCAAPLQVWRDDYLVLPVFPAVQT